ncbi:hypothetical protein LTR05_007396 [Lithohypha guttulata]|uniref:Enoyl reductase (ER) domain-containing protein n=1 Tax=Lithohypha guttulata TaxID=1690604 RepID=A0AAN7SV59_9EURO|nr:hypothetical protein LTR05_007396 [Lithohypha guttulata]
MGDTSLPSTGKAACVENPGADFKVVVRDDVPVPQPGNMEVLIKLSVTGICYSDLHYMLEDLPMPKMSEFNVVSPGHEGVGTIVALGTNIPVSLSLNLGDRVGLKPVYTSCNSCLMCTTDREMYCSASLQTGLHRPGTYQQYVIGAAEHVVKIPDGVPDDVAAPIMCSGATIYRGITEAGLKPGDWVAFAGAGGGVGHMGVMYARAMGMRVIAIDGGEEKDQMCKKIGAEHFVDFTKVKDVNAEVIRLADGSGVHGLIVTATSAAAYRSGAGMLRTSGVLMSIGLHVPLIADPLTLVGKNLKITGTAVGTRNDVKMALQFAAQGLVKPVIEHYKFDKIPDAVYKLKSGKVAGRCVVSFED